MINKGDIVVDKGGVFKCKVLEIFWKDNVKSVKLNWDTGDSMEVSYRDMFTWIETMEAKGLVKLIKGGIIIHRIKPHKF
jgi:hypothetical protein